MIVGLPDTAVKESQDRVTTAISNSGYYWPRGRTTINLAPGRREKGGPELRSPDRARHDRDRAGDRGGSVRRDELRRRAGAERRGPGGQRRAAGRARGAAARETRRSSCRKQMRAKRRWSRGSTSTACGTCARPSSSLGAKTSCTPVPGDLSEFFATPPELRGRFRRRQRPGPRQARGRSGGRRRTQHPHDRPARLRQIDALETDRHHHPADGAGGSDRDDQNPQHRGIVQARSIPLSRPGPSARRITPSRMSDC